MERSFKIVLAKTSFVIFLIITLLSAFLFLTPFAYSDDEDRWTGKDKALHLTVSCGIDISLYNFLKKNTNYTDSEAKAAAFFGTLFIGVTKEFIDDSFSWKDVGADVLGTGIGAALSVEF